eukprot:1137766-Pelagomonas_calceolata.AAC.2
MPSYLAIQVMGGLGGRLLDGLLTGGRDANLEGWQATRRIRINLDGSKLGVLAVVLIGGTHCYCQH